MKTAVVSFSELATNTGTNLSASDYFAKKEREARTIAEKLSDWLEDHSHNPDHLYRVIQEYRDNLFDSHYSIEDVQQDIETNIIGFELKEQVSLVWDAVLCAASTEEPA